MRIISGKWRSKRIKAPKNLPSRPTTDFGKESLFNILNNRFFFEDLRVLIYSLVPVISAMSLLREVLRKYLP